MSVDSVQCETMKLSIDLIQTEPPCCVHNIAYRSSERKNRGKEISGVGGGGAVAETEES